MEGFLCAVKDDDGVSFRVCSEKAITLSPDIQSFCVARLRAQDFEQAQAVLLTCLQAGRYDDVQVNFWDFKGDSSVVSTVGQLRRGDFLTTTVSEIFSSDDGLAEDPFLGTEMMTCLLQ